MASQINEPLIDNEAANFDVDPVLRRRNTLSIVNRRVMEDV